MTIEIGSENYNIRIPKLQDFFQKLKEKFPKDGDLQNLDVYSLSESDVQNWEYYERFLKLISKALEAESKAQSKEEISFAISLILSQLPKETFSYVESFIKSRITAIKAVFDLEKLLPSHDSVLGVSKELQKQYQMIEV